MKSTFLLALILFLAACSNSSSKPADEAKPEVALPASGEGDNNVFKATGEVIVIFEPSPTRASQLQEEGNEEVTKNKSSFEQTSQEYIKRLEAMGIRAYTSQEDFIKISITEKQSYVVHAPGYDKGYGIALARLNTQPKVINGIPTWEELEKEVKAYYGK